MKSIRYIFPFLALSGLMSLASCDKDSGFNADYGYVSLNISRDESVMVKSDDTRADDPTFRVAVKNKSGVQVASYSDHHVLATDPLKLAAGSYTIEASTGELASDGSIPQAVFDKPVYFGETQVDVTAGKSAQAEVVCTLSQVKVSVNLDQSITDNFTTVIVTVTNGENFENSLNTLIFSTDENTIDNIGYFTATGSLKYKLYLVNNDNEVSDGDIYGTISGVAAREHYQLNLTLSEGDEGSAVLPGIGADGSTNDKSYNINVNLNKKAKPEFSTNGFDISQEQYVSVGSELKWQVNVNSAAGLQKFQLMHSSAEFLSRGIPNIVDLVNATADQVSDCNSAGITWSGFVSGSTSDASIDFTGLIKQLPLGDYSFSFYVLDEQAQFVEQTFCFKVIPAVETSTISVEPWGKHAVVYAMYNTQTQPSGMGFEYRKSSESSWIKVTSGLSVSGTNYSVKLSGLDPNTSYVVRAVSDKEPSNELSFTTLGADQILNMGFDNWIKSGKSYYPNASLSDADYVWDSGNDGANLLSEVNPTKPTSTVAVSGEGKQAALLETKAVLGVLAAGSLYTGKFGDVAGTSGAELKFGTPYNCKPLTLKGYYQYSPKAIDKTRSPYESLAGTMDSFQIYVVIADWPQGYFDVNTSTGTFIQPDTDPNIIGYGSIEGNTATNGYVEFEIPINYRENTGNRVPTTCVIVCASSKLGDYFTGGVGSTLCVDEFEFTF